MSAPVALATTRGDDWPAIRMRTGDPSLAGCPAVFVVREAPNAPRALFAVKLSVDPDGVLSIEVPRAASVGIPDGNHVGAFLIRLPNGKVRSIHPKTNRSRSPFFPILVHPAPLKPGDPIEEPSALPDEPDEEIEEP